MRVLEAIRRSGRAHPDAALAFAALASWLLILVAVNSVLGMPAKERTRDEVLLGVVFGASLTAGAAILVRARRRIRQREKIRMSGGGGVAIPNFVGLSLAVNPAPPLVRDLIFAAVSGAVAVLTSAALLRSWRRASIK
jgi:hypothetical protein